MKSNENTRKNNIKQENKRKPNENKWFPNFSLFFFVFVHCFSLCPLVFPWLRRRPHLRREAGGSSRGGGLGKTTKTMKSNERQWKHNEKQWKHNEKQWKNKKTKANQRKINDFIFFHCFSLCFYCFSLFFIVSAERHVGAPGEGARKNKENN